MAVATPLWTHPHVANTNVHAFRDFVNRTHALDLTSYQELHAWSVADTEAFARAVWTFCGIRYSQPPTAAAIGLERMHPRPQWFPSACLNYAENMLALGLAARPDAVVVTECREGGVQLREYTYK